MKRMFGKKTLFIIGAGASAELGFPLGYGLAKLIQQNTSIYPRQGGLPDGPGTILMMALGGSSPGTYTDNQLLTAARILNRGVTYNASIDDFLSVHAQSDEVVKMGKVAIIQAILNAERNSKLDTVIDDKQLLNTSRLEETWLLQLSQILLRGHTRDTVQNVFNNVAFVTFNYDRSLEIFLIHALKDGFAIKSEDACEIVKQATIIHAYGAVGNLPGLAPTNLVAFGSNREIRELANTDSIQTYSESAADPKPIHEEIEKAEQVVFLGFAFHPQNMALLKPQPLQSPKTFIATTHGMSELDVTWAAGALRSYFGQPIQGQIDNGRTFFHPSAVKCAELMSRYALTLGQR
ncbi:MAG: hypothetical protein V4559_08415 [Pseudomonadota bacterium]